MPAANVAQMSTARGERITTNRTIGADLHRSMELRGWPAGTTWGDFVDAVERSGVRRNDPLGAIEYGNAVTGSGRLVIDRDTDVVGVVIREAR